MIREALVLVITWGMSPSLWVSIVLRLYRSGMSISYKILFGHLPTVYYGLCEINIHTLIRISNLIFWRLFYYLFSSFYFQLFFLWVRRVFLLENYFSSIGILHEKFFLENLNKCFFNYGWDPFLKRINCHEIFCWNKLVKKYFFMGYPISIEKNDLNFSSSIFPRHWKSSHILYSKNFVQNSF